MKALDKNYTRQRLSLVQQVVTAIGSMWLQRDWKDRRSFLDPANTMLDGAVEAYTALISSYFNTRAEEVTGDPVDYDIDPLELSRDKIRPDDPEFLNQVWGTLVHRLEKGDEFVRADQSATATAKKLTVTHLQMAHARAAKSWLEGADADVIGYRRVFNPPGCDHCRVASERLYYKETLMPIHENCNCGIAPVFRGEDHGLFTGKRKNFPTLATPDDTLGSRLDQTVELPAGA